MTSGFFFPGNIESIFSFGIPFNFRSSTLLNLVMPRATVIPKGSLISTTSAFSKVPETCVIPIASKLLPLFRIASTAPLSTDIEPAGAGKKLAIFFALIDLNQLVQKMFPIFYYR